MTRLKNLYSNASGSLMQSRVMWLQHCPLLERNTIPFFIIRKSCCVYWTCNTGLSPFSIDKQINQNMWEQLPKCGKLKSMLVFYLQSTEKQVKMKQLPACRAIFSKNIECTCFVYNKGHRQRWWVIKYLLNRLLLLRALSLCVQRNPYRLKSDLEWTQTCFSLFSYKKNHIL